MTDDEQFDPTTLAMDLTPEMHRALRSPHLLRQVAGPGAPREKRLVSERVVVGRAADADITVDSKKVSRHHAAIERTAEGFTCRDLDSSNGTWVERVRVASASLRDGDTIQLGDAVFEYRER